jgi:dethiobiotin synthetase
MTQQKRSDYFVTGTDTEIGKTLVSAALLLALREGGQSAVGMKPVAAGAHFENGAWHNEDVDMLLAASSPLQLDAPTQKMDLVCPYLMQMPAAPHIVAQHENRSISLPHIQSCFQQLQAGAQAVIVEGVGGFFVPLSERTSTVDLAQQLALPVILVVGMRLGCINHALLTAQAIRAAGLQLVAWVANTVDADMLFINENRNAIAQRIGAPLIGVLPRFAKATPEEAAHYLDLSLLK